MVSFDAALRTLVRIVENHSPGADLETICVVRDYRGRLRLVVQPAKADWSPSEDLRGELARQLGSYFVLPVLFLQPGGRQDAHDRVAKWVLERAAEWPEVTAEAPEVPPEAATRWRKLETHLSKLGWLSEVGETAAWELTPGRPFVVSFYSFKGGVGRTTLTLACALDLVRRGKRVAVVDLDVEAPGVAPLVGGQSERTVLDVLVDHAATGEPPDIGALRGPPADWGIEADRLSFITAGTLDQRYLQKLARLDFAGHVARKGEPPPAAGALRALLERVADQDYDAILVDCRAGLHDIAGLSVNRLAHVDVFVVRQSKPDLEGLRLVLEAWARLKPKAMQQRAVLVHSFVPEERELAQLRRERLCTETLDMFQELGLVSEGEPRTPTARGSGHFPWPVTVNSPLLNGEAPTPDRLQSAEYEAITQRILDLVKQEP